MNGELFIEEMKNILEMHEHTLKVFKPIAEKLPELVGEKVRLKNMKPSKKLKDIVNDKLAYIGCSLQQFMTIEPVKNTDKFFIFTDGEGNLLEYSKNAGLQKCKGLEHDISELKKIINEGPESFEAHKKHAMYLSKQLDDYIDSLSYYERRYI